MGVDGWLRDGEEVRWSGRPARRMPLDRVDVVGVLLLGVLVLFAAVWQTVGVYGPDGMQSASLAASVLAFGIVLAALVRRRSGTVSYVVTDRRVLVQTSKGIDGMLLAGLPAPTVFAESRDGVGSVSFGPPNRFRHALAALMHGPDAPHAGMHLVQIENAREVAGLLRAAIHGRT